jgi:hypothetical protein
VSSSSDSPQPTSAISKEWLFGWDPTPGIVSIWADGRGHATIWRRIPGDGRLVREKDRFRPWVLLDRLDDLRHLGDHLSPPGGANAGIWYRELQGAGALRFLVSANDARTLKTAILTGAQDRLGRRLTNLRDLGQEIILALPPEEQYLVATGRNYFRDLPFDELHRLQFDLETQGLNPSRDRIFMIAVRDQSGEVRVLESQGDSDAAESDLLREFCQVVREADPDVIENHNLHGFDLPFLNRRAAILGVPLHLARIGPPGFSNEPPAEDSRRRRKGRAASGSSCPAVNSSTRWMPSGVTTLPPASCRATA